MLSQVLRALAGRFDFNVNVSFGINGGFEPAASTEPPKGRIVQLPVGPSAAPKWADAEQDEKERFAANVVEEDKHKHTATPNPDDSGLMTGAVAENLKAELVTTSFRGTVNRRTLIDKAVKLGFRKDAGIRLWNLLEISTGLRKLCNDYNVDFPPLDKNGKFRRVDLRELASLGDITSVPGFGSRSQALTVLRAL